MSQKTMWNILDHKAKVGSNLRTVITELVQRAVEHDFSKFSPEEFAPFESAIPRFEQTEYGSEEYKAVVQSIQPAINHHLTNNRHHPEFFPNGIDDMNLIDVIEMMCDWKAAAERMGKDDVRLDINQHRFGISNQLLGIIARTLDYLNAQEAS